MGLTVVGVIPTTSAYIQKAIHIKKTQPATIIGGRPTNRVNFVSTKYLSSHKRFTNLGAKPEIQFFKKIGCKKQLFFVRFAHDTLKGMDFNSTSNNIGFGINGKTDGKDKEPEKS